MPYIIWPEVRHVSEGWIVGRAHDAMIDEALEQEVARRGIEGQEVPDDFWPNVPTPSYEDARAFLDDRGLVTFAAPDADGRRLREQAIEDDALRD